MARCILGRCVCPSAHAGSIGRLHTRYGRPPRLLALRPSFSAPHGRTSAAAGRVSCGAWRCLRCMRVGLNDVSCASRASGSVVSSSALLTFGSVHLSRCTLSTTPVGRAPKRSKRASTNDGAASSPSQQPSSATAAAAAAAVTAQTSATVEPTSPQPVRKTKAGSTPTSPRRTRKATTPKDAPAAPPCQTVEIDLPDLVKEWSALRLATRVPRLAAEGTARDSEAESKQSAASDSAAAPAAVMNAPKDVKRAMEASVSSSSSSPPTPSRVLSLTFSAGKQEVGLAERSAMLSALQKDPGEYPQLHSLLYADQYLPDRFAHTVARKLASVWQLKVTDAEAAVADEAAVVSVLSLLRVLRQLSRQPGASAHLSALSGQLEAATLAAVTTACSTPARSQKIRSATQSSTVGAFTVEQRRVLLRVLLEQHRGQTEVVQRGVLGHADETPSTARDAVKRKPNATRTPRTGKQAIQSAARERWLSETRQLLTAASTPFAESVVQQRHEQRKRQQTHNAKGEAAALSSSRNTVWDTLLDLTVLLVSAELEEAVRGGAQTVGGDGKQIHTLAQSWRALASEIEGDMVSRLESSAHDVRDVNDAQGSTPTAPPSKKLRKTQKEAALSRLSTSPAVGVSLRRVVDVTTDALNTLTLAKEVAVVLPVPLQQQLQTLCGAVVQASCASAAASATVFEALCSPDIARRLERLRRTDDGVLCLYAQLCTDVFTAASSYLARDADRVPALVDRLEAQCFSARAADGSARDNGAPPLTRPPLHSTTSTLCYGLLCAGFAPEAVLNSGLCVSLSLVDLVDVVHAGSLFSSAFALSPFPVRVRSGLIEGTVAAASRCVKDTRRMVLSPIDVIEMDEATAAGAGLSARVRAGASPDPPDHNVQRASYETESRTSASRESAPAPAVSRTLLTAAEFRVSVNRVFYVALSAVAECLMRGDSAGVSRLLLSIFPLLDHEGGCAFLVEALSYVTDGFTSSVEQVGILEDVESDVDEATAVAAMVACGVKPSRLARVAASTTALSFTDSSTSSASDAVGRSTARSEGEGDPLVSRGTDRGTGVPASASGAAAAVVLPTNRLRCTTAEMEKALTDMTTLFIPRVSESVLLTWSKQHGGELGGGGVGSSGNGGGDGTSSDALWGSHTKSAANSKMPLAQSASTALAASAAATGTARSAVVVATPGGSSKQTRKQADQLLRLTLQCTEDALTCGMLTNTARQLTTLHTTILKARETPTRAEDGLKEALRVVERMGEFVDGLQRKHLSLSRHPQAAATRLGSIALHNIVAAYLSSTATAASTAASVGSGATGSVAPAVAVRRRKHYVLSVVHVLYQLSEHYPVLAEPPTLRAFRTDLLDVALTHVLTSSLAPSSGEAPARPTSPSSSLPLTESEQGTGTAGQLSLATLTEIAVVICVRRTVHHVSHAFFESLTRAVVQQLHARTARHAHDAVLMERFVRATAVVCLRGDEKLTTLFLSLLDASEPLLSPSHVLRVLDDFWELGVPCTSLPVQRMLQRVVLLLSKKNNQTNEQITMLRTLTRYSAVTEVDGQVPYGPLLMRLARPDYLKRRRFSFAACGELVFVVARLQTRLTTLPADRFTAEERQCIATLPRQLAVVVLQSQQSTSPHDIPPILSGYAILPDRLLREQVLRAFIARTIRACPALSPTEVVQCVEAYCTAAIYHEYLFGVLLSRVADVKQTFSLEQAVHLLQCGTASGNAHVRTACLTAAQPVFVAHVRHLVQSDANLLVAVTSVSTTILHCLSQCFPRDGISVTVLETIARYHAQLTLPVATAALELIATRGAVDYDVVRVLTDVAVGRLFPACSPHELVDLAWLLVECGVRSAALLDAIRSRFAQVVHDADGYVLARLAAVYERAGVEADTVVLELLVQRVQTLAAPSSEVQEDEEGGKKRARNNAALATPSRPPLTAPQVATLLRWLQTVSVANLTVVIPAVDVLLPYLQSVWTTTPCTTTSTAAAGDGVGLTELSVADVDTVLRVCLELSSTPKDHLGLVRNCADYLRYLLNRVVESEVSSGDGATAVAATGNRPTHSPSHAKSTAAHETASSVEAVASTAPPSLCADAAVWGTDLFLLVNTADRLVRLSQAQHPVVRDILTVLYTRRSALLQRHLLRETVKQTLKQGGKALHPKLYEMVVEGSLV